MEEIGKSISLDELLLLLQTDTILLSWIYKQSSCFDYDNVGRHLDLEAPASLWLEAFAQNSPVPWENVLKEILGEDIYSEIRKIVDEKAAEEKRRKEEEARREKEILWNQEENAKKAVVGAIINGVIEKCLKEEKAKKTVVGEIINGVVEKCLEEEKAKKAVVGGIINGVIARCLKREKAMALINSLEALVVTLKKKMDIQ